MTRRPGLLISCVVAALGLGPATARANFTPVQTVSYGTPPSSPINLDFQRTASFQKFDTALGTLTGVDISLEATLSGNLIGIYGGSGPTTITVTGFGAITVTVPNLATPGAGTLNVPLTITGSHMLTGAVGDDSFSMPASATQTQPLTLSLPTDLDNFKGPGLTTMLVDAHSDPRDVVVNGQTFHVSSYFTSTNGNGGGYVVEKGSAILSLSYEYTPTVTPEPAGLVLLASGGVVLLLARRLRRGGGRNP